MTATKIVRIPDEDSAEYDRYFTIPEGEDPTRFAYKISEAIKVARIAAGEDGLMGDDMERIISDFGLEYVIMFDTVAW